MVDPLSYYSFQPMLHNLYYKGYGMCYPVCELRLSGPLPYVSHHIVVIKMFWEHQ